MEIFAAIALLCQVTGTYGSISVAVSGQYSSREKERIELSYSEASNSQKNCQKYYVNCFRKSEAQTDTSKMEKCVLDRK